MKCISKKYLLEYAMIKSTEAELKFQKKSDNPFLCDVLYTFNTEEKINTIMPFYRGGDMFTIMQNQGAMPEEWAKFYIMCISTGVAYLHNNGIIFRDVKPENVLMDNKGYVSLCDFGKIV